MLVQKQNSPWGRQGRRWKFNEKEILRKGNCTTFSKKKKTHLRALRRLQGEGWKGNMLRKRKK